MESLFRNAKISYRPYINEINLSTCQQTTRQTQVKTHIHPEQVKHGNMKN